MTHCPSCNDNFPQPKASYRLPGSYFSRNLNKQAFGCIEFEAEESAKKSLDWILPSQVPAQQTPPPKEKNTKRSQLFDLPQSAASMDPCVSRLQLVAGRWRLAGLLRSRKSNASSLHCSWQVLRAAGNKGFLQAHTKGCEEVYGRSISPRHLNMPLCDPRELRCNDSLPEFREKKN